ncbi:HsmA family protein [Leifsonia sp. EB34]|uniref:HsmA family protein n=1 Tax=Leifsonia sp. EB34 TaxID=3156303 RepID=UPI0035191777
MLIGAVVLITLALVFYSVGVWAERIRRLLLWWHAAFFAAGFICDLSGTLVMSGIAATSGGPVGSLADALTVVMAVTGTLALALMGLHLVWAVVVLIRQRPAELRRFHTFSIVVWSIWLVPFVAGALAANLR